MKKKCVLISGQTVVSDKELENGLKKSAVILTNSDNSSIESIIKNQKVDLILFEMSQSNESDIAIIKNIKDSFPQIKILFIDGNGDPELIAKAFHFGAQDAFHKPYKCDLIVERVDALLARCDKY